MNRLPQKLFSFGRFGHRYPHDIMYNKVTTNRFVSSDNPMFVGRSTSPLLHQQSTSTDEPNGPSGNEDLLSRHGGKIALFGFSFATALIYRWFIGGKNRTDLEEKITEESPLHPYESNDLRIKNTLTVEQLKAFASRSYDEFPDGHAKYTEFIDLFQKHVDCRIREGNVMDRIILNRLENTYPGIDGRHPISFYLVALSNAVYVPVDDRIALLFEIAKLLDRKDYPYSLASGGMDYCYCHQDNVATLVDLLIDARQIPFEKMIRESGKYLPFKEYRKKSASEMIFQGVETLKPPPHKRECLNLDEFTDLLTGNSICVWGECYRKN